MLKVRAGGTAGRATRWAGLVLVAVGLALTAPGSAFGVGVVHEHAAEGDVRDLDNRAGTVAPTSEQREAVRRLDARVEWSAFGTPASLFSVEGFLATGLPGSEAEAARAFLRANRELFRLSEAEVDDLRVLNDSPLGRDGGHAVLFRQRFGSLNAGQDGLVAVGVVRGSVAYASSSLAGDTGAPAPATISALDAYRKAAADLGRTVGRDDVGVLGVQRGWNAFKVAGVVETQRARLVAVPTPGDGVRAAYETIVLDNDDDHGPLAVTHFIDARSGAVLMRQNRVDRATEQWQVFPANPPLDAEDGTDRRQIWCWEQAEGCDRVLDGPGSPERTGEWDTQQTAAEGAAEPTFTTEGNAARTAASRFSFLTPGPDANVRAMSTNRHYTAADPQARATWTNQWSTAKCNPNVFGTVQNNDIFAATTNLFAMHNRMHDWSYQLGFTEKNYNLQVNNFGRTSPDNAGDPEVGNAQAGAAFGQPSFRGRDNANQITLNDGIAPITNMYLWQPIAGAFYPPCVDGDYDMSVIGHEYTHAISGRMVGGPDTGILGREGGSMNESWSDLGATEYLNEYGFVPTDGENPFSVGAYVTGDKQAGIRNYGMNRSPLNYSNVGYDLTGAQVHADGEIWSATNFEIRSRMNDKFDGAFPSGDADLQRRCADGAVDPKACPGNRRWYQLLYDAYLLMPARTSMPAARDAYLAADKMRFGGENQELLWGVFARRGLGQFALADNNNVRSFNDTETPPTDVSPRPSFDSPRTNEEANVAFAPADVAGGPAPPKVQFFLGDYQARTTPIADTDPDTDLGADFNVMPGTYDFIARADGYGAVSFRRTVGARERVNVDVPMQRNLASADNGATIDGDGGNPGFDEENPTANEEELKASSLRALIDDTEDSNWASFAGEEGDGDDPEQGAQEEPRTVEGRKVTVALAGGKQVVDRVQVSALLRASNPNDSGGDNTTQNRFSALRQFEILTCVASEANGGCTKDDGFAKIYTSPADAFPSVAPRPRVPELTLRPFDVPDTEATHVRMRVLTNQCTGAPDFQGDQDADPQNNSDCSEGRPVLIASQGDIVRAAELQVFAPRPAAATEPGSGPGGTSNPGPGPGGTSDPGPGSRPGGPSGTPDAGACVSTAGFRSTSGAPRGGRAALKGGRRVGRAVTVDIFQQSRGSRIVGERLVARFTGRKGSFAWNGRGNRGRKRLTDGYYFVRYRMGLEGGRKDVRRETLRRSKGRFSRRASFYRRESCGLLRSYKLERPVFGGRGRRALGVAFKLAAPSRVAVEVLRGSRVVRRYPTVTRPGGVTQRLRFAGRGPRGDYRFRLTARRPDGTAVRAILTARRL